MGLDPAQWYTPTNALGRCTNEYTEHARRAYRLPAFLGTCLLPQIPPLKKLPTRSSILHTQLRLPPRHPAGILTTKGNGIHTKHSFDSTKRLDSNPRIRSEILGVGGVAAPWWAPASSIEPLRRDASCVRGRQHPSRRRHRPDTKFPPPTHRKNVCLCCKQIREQGVVSLHTHTKHTRATTDIFY